MSAIEARRRADLAALERLVQASRGELVLRGRPVAVQSRIELELRVPLAAGPGYPRDRRMVTPLVIDLPARYPFEPPVVRLPDGALPHPNVFESGVVCIGSRWRASEGLDLFVRRVARLLCFDPLLVNLQSLANPSAAGWYRAALRRHPEAFPSARIDWPLEGEAAVQQVSAASAQSASSDPDRVIRPCPSCGARLRLPAARSGTVECPRCHHAFDTRT
ncbi:MAG TPA: ubiquitin-conjugating enzyme E2 [Burkholderiaceae bacterium]|nr:ubiquitin-conjugating enzyme E2 [Burkholderiaceae bacterium]